MKVNCYAIQVGLLMLVSSLYADLTDPSIGSEKMPLSHKDSQRNQSGHPFKLEFHGDIVGKAKFRNSDAKGHLKYNSTESEVRFIFYYNPECKEGAYTTLSYETCQLKWDQNPFFKKNAFHTASLALGGFTERLPDWRWASELMLNLDTDHPNLNKYFNYNLLFWGRYTYNCDVGLHVGILIESGMKIDWVYPVVGFDWKISDCWKLNVIYPLNISVEYQLSKCWSVELAARVFEERHRVGRTAPLPRALVTYRNTGGELGLNFDCGWLQANLHAGYTFGGMFKIADQNYRHKHHFRFDSSGYAGGEIALHW